jgi:hypothetical protein
LQDHLQVPRAPGCFLGTDESVYPQNPAALLTEANFDAFAKNSGKISDSIDKAEAVEATFICRDVQIFETIRLSCIEFERNKFRA